MILQPSLILEGSIPSIALSIAVSVVGLCFTAIALTGWMFRRLALFESLGLFACSMAVLAGFVLGWHISYIGMALGGAFVVYFKIKGGVDKQLS